jgi:cytosine/adenosine deaminase-related metal-dependent hydrolase
MVLLSLLCWGPIPLACLWLGSRANYLSSSIALGITVSFGSTGIALFGSLSALQRIDQAWILVRRAAGRDQRKGTLARIFAATAITGAALFTLWFLVILGPNDPNL